MIKQLLNNNKILVKKYSEELENLFADKINIEIKNETPRILYYDENYNDNYNYDEEDKNYLMYKKVLKLIEKEHLEFIKITVSKNGSKYFIVPLATNFIMLEYPSNYQEIFTSWENIKYKLKNRIE